jgi:hypothetical protein
MVQIGKLRIAQISPLTEAVPPKLYGGTERVISWLTKELVALGHNVTKCFLDLAINSENIGRPCSHY